MKMLRRALEGDEVTADPAATPDTNVEGAVDKNAVPDTPEPETSSKKLDSEKELVIYAKIVNFEQLKDARSIEHQEQFEIKIPKTDKNAIDGKIRIRMSVKEGKEPKYVICTKTKLPDGSSYESEVKTTVENFLQFKYLAEGGMIKDRYSFKVEGHKDLEWEIDVFTGANGALQEWCKIDLELTEDLPTLPAFPIELSDVIASQYGARTPEEETIVRTLYDTVFRTANPFLTVTK